MTLDDIRLYLPKYLSSNSREELFSGLKDFPENIDSRLYTNFLKETDILYQGDGIRDLLVVNLPATDIKSVSAMVISNTCDLHQGNPRLFHSRIMYSPIISLSAYQDRLKEQLKDKAHKVDSLIVAIRKQEVTQIFYLPEFPNVIAESIVFLDRVHNIENDYVERANLKKQRIFTLSDYGIYLFIFKLSLHFTRIHDKVERKSIPI